MGGARMKFVSGGCLVFLCLAVGIAQPQAQSATRGTTSAALPKDLGKREDTISLESVRLRWSFGLLLGEPTYSFTGDYRIPRSSLRAAATITHASVCTPRGVMPSSKSAALSPKDMPQNAWADAVQRIKLLSNSLFRVILVNNVGGLWKRIYIEVRPDSLIREGSSETSLSVPASPAWDKVFKVASGEPSPSDPWLPAEQAKAIFKQGVHVREVQLIEPHFDLSALRDAYNRHLDQTCAPQQPSETAHKKETGTRGKTEEKAALPTGQPPKPESKTVAAKPQLDMAMFDTAKRTGVGKPAAAPPSPSSSAPLPAARSGDANASMLLLIDASGSMQGSRIAEAKRAARDAIRRAASVSGTEFSVASFSGECSSPQISILPFTKDAQAAERFIQSINAGGGTPLGPAVSHVNRFMDKNRSPGSKTQVIILLADGDDNCNDVSDQVARLKREGILFRHETIGLETGAKASEQLRQVATASGGGYHRAASTEELAQTFKAATENIRLLDMLGGFGKPNSRAEPTGSGRGYVNWDILTGTSK